MRRQLLAIAVVLGATRAPAAAASRDSVTTPYPGIVHEVWTEPAMPARIHVVLVDLTSAEITVRATREEDRGRTTGAFAAAVGAQVAINGDFFAPAGYVPDGLAMGDGNGWTSTADDGLSAVFRFGKVASRTDGLIIVPESVVAFGDLPSFTTGVIGGRPMLVRAGQAVTSFDCGDSGAMSCLRAPRTALALSDDNRTLWLVTVDGWQQGSVGMTAAELAGFLRDRGVRDAIGLDGGGASTLIIANQGGLVNEPSDGVQRPVANHLGIVFGAQPPGTLIGEVREGSLSGPAVTNALVTLDDGREHNTGATGQRYEFTPVAPRFTCVTVEKTGYNTVTQCRQVEPGIVNFNSIVMFPIGTGPDAGVPDAGMPTDGGDLPADAPGGDGGNPGGGDGGGDGGGGEGGCCAAGAQGGGDAAGVAWLALAVVFGLCGRSPRRRRRS
jgi:hypothetical protein